MLPVQSHKLMPGLGPKLRARLASEGAALAARNMRVETGVFKVDSGRSDSDGHIEMEDMSGIRVLFAGDLRPSECQYAADCAEDFMREFTAENGVPEVTFEPIIGRRGDGSWYQSGFIVAACEPDPKAGDQIMLLGYSEGITREAGTILATFEGEHGQDCFRVKRATDGHFVTVERGEFETMSEYEQRSK